VLWLWLLILLTVMTGCWYYWLLWLWLLIWLTVVMTMAFDMTDLLWLWLLILLTVVMTGFWYDWLLLWSITDCWYDYGFWYYWLVMTMAVDITDCCYDWLLILLTDFWYDYGCWYDWLLLWLWPLILLTVVMTITFDYDLLDMTGCWYEIKMAFDITDCCYDYSFWFDWLVIWLLLLKWLTVVMTIAFDVYHRKRLLYTHKN
jgi:hypothetical protein